MIFCTGIQLANRVTFRSPAIFNFELMFSSSPSQFLNVALNNKSIEIHHLVKVAFQMVSLLDNPTSRFPSVEKYMEGTMLNVVKKSVYNLVVKQKMIPHLLSTHLLIKYCWPGLLEMPNFQK